MIDPSLWTSQPLGVLLPARTYPDAARDLQLTSSALRVDMSVALLPCQMPGLLTLHTTAI